jgi:ribosomal peptide maturation radical SAM protein 1
MVQHLSGGSFEERMQTLMRLTGKPWFPFNEWIFAGQVYDSEPKAASFTLQQMRRQTRMQPKVEAICTGLLRLRSQAGELVSTMVDQLADFELIGISSTFLQNMPALALARSIKSRWPDKIVMLGGANCDGEMGRALLEQFPFLDYTFTGEMDVAFADFIEHLACNEPVDNMVGVNGRRANGSLFSGPPALPIEVMDELPIPDFDDYVHTWEDTGHSAHHKLVLTMESSRGCWWGQHHHCTFCGLNANGMHHRCKSNDRFISEIEAVVRKYDAKYLYLTDNILPMDFYGEFVDWARASNLELNFFYEIKSNVKRTHVERLASAGINSVQPGIESFSTKILRLMRKGVTGIQNVTFLRLAREHGILASYNILVGFPNEDASEYARLANEIPKLTHLQPPMAMAEIEFHRFSPYHSNPEQFGLRLKPSWHYEHLYPFEKETVARIAYVFEPDGCGSEPRRYLKPLAEQLRRWANSFRLNSCTLTWKRDGQEILVMDTRPGFGPKTYRFQQFAIDLFLFLDEPHSVRSILNFANRTKEAPPATRKLQEKGEVIISFSAWDFLEDHRRFLDALEQVGLVFAERPESSQPTLPIVTDESSTGGGMQYVALPVPSEHRLFEPGWLVV